MFIFQQIINKGEIIIKVLHNSVDMTTIRLVTEEGLKTMSTEDALELAYDEGLDLVCMKDSDNICKLMDYNKYMYALKKSKKQTKQLVVKEIKLNPEIAMHDLDIKLNGARKMLVQGCRVKVILSYKGRMMQRIDSGEILMHKVIEGLANYSVIHTPLKKEGNNWVVVFDKK